MPYSPLAIANWFIKRAKSAKRPIDPLKLQKLVYFAHGWNLAIRGKPLIDETVEAWPYGPVIPTIYHEFKRYGSMYIDSLAFGVKNGDVYCPEVSPDDEPTIALLEKVWEVYGHLTGTQLSTLTHADGTPWAALLAARNGAVPRGTDLGDEAIRAYFRGQMRTPTTAGA